jgi:uracil-DNA glycosylase family 4
MKLYTTEEKRDSLDVLGYQVRTCKKCRLSLTRKHALPGEGNPDARIFFVALSPGAKEDIQNRMFVGPSGQVFNQLLHDAGIERETVYMTNLVKCLLPKNRKPSETEIEACGYFLDAELDIVQPEVIVPLGFYATRAVLKRYDVEKRLQNTGFRNLNGRLLTFEETKIFPLTHPSALLYNPSYKAETVLNYRKLNTFK